MLPNQMKNLEKIDFTIQGIRISVQEEIKSTEKSQYCYKVSPSVVGRGYHIRKNYNNVSQSTSRK